MSMEPRVIKDQNNKNTLGNKPNTATKYVSSLFPRKVTLLISEIKTFFESIEEMTDNRM